MASPNTLKSREELKALRKGSVKVTQPFLIYGANRLTRRTQLRQVYKEGFLSWEEAKQAIREEDRKKLRKFANFKAFIQGRIEEVKEECRKQGEEITDEQAFEIVKKQAADETRQQAESAAEDARLEKQAQEADTDGETADAAPVQ